MGTKKKCRDCGEWKNTVANFFPSKVVKGTQYYSSYCRPCMTIRNQRNDRARRAKHHLRLWAYYEEHPCISCGEDNPMMLSLDHIGDDKENDVSSMMRGPWRKIIKEIRKCVVLCHNCHAVKTHASLGHHADPELRIHLIQWPENAAAFEEYE